MRGKAAPDLEPTPNPSQPTPSPPQKEGRATEARANAREYAVAYARRIHYKCEVDCEVCWMWRSDMRCQVREVMEAFLAGVALVCKMRN